jgi:hypothetical protein
MSVGKFCQLARGTRPPFAIPSSIRSTIPSLLRDKALTSSAGPTRRRSTRRGTATPCAAPRLLIHMHRVLWMWAAIIPIVRPGMPGTGLLHIERGRLATR